MQSARAMGTKFSSATTVVSNIKYVLDTPLERSIEQLLKAAHSIQCCILSQLAPCVSDFRDGSRTHIVRRFGLRCRLCL